MAVRRRHASEINVLSTSRNELPSRGNPFPRTPRFRGGPGWGLHPGPPYSAASVARAPSSGNTFPIRGVTPFLRISSSQIGWMRLSWSAPRRARRHRPRRQNRRRISPRQRLIPAPATITTRPASTPRLPSSRSRSLYSVREREPGTACDRRLSRAPRATGRSQTITFSCSAPAEHSPVPAARSERRRAQRPSRMAGTLTYPLATPLPGHSLTAASTTARWRGTGTADHTRYPRPYIAATASPQKNAFVLTVTTPSMASVMLGRSSSGVRSPVATKRMPPENLSPDSTAAGAKK
jgi:hypothetical protein